MSKLKVVFPLVLVAAFLFGCVSVSAAELDNSFPVKFPPDTARMRIRGPTWDTVQQNIILTYDESTNTYYSSNVNASNVTAIQIGSLNHENYIDFTFIPDVYNYYFVSTIDAETDVANFTFVPYRQTIVTYDCDTGYVNTRTLDFSVYHHDTTNRIGFTTIAKLPDLTNTAIGSFHYSSSTSSTVPANLTFSGLIIAVPKQTVVDLSYIEELLENIDANTDNIESILNGIFGALNYFSSTDFDKGSVNDTQNAIDDLHNGESNLLDDTTQYEDDLNITLDESSNAEIWSTVDSFVKSNGKVFALFITLLTCGFVKLVLNR